MKKIFIILSQFLSNHFPKQFLKKNIYLYLFFLIVFLITSSNSIFALSKNFKNILVINSYHKGYMWSDKIMMGLQTILKNWDKTDIYYEYMDTKRINSKDYYRNLKSIYKLKYKHTLFNIILVSDDNGLQFCLKNQNNIFNNSPIIFCGINKYNNHMFKNYTNVTGVIEKYNPLDTVKAIQKIFPDKTHYIAITDSTKSGHINSKLLNNTIKQVNYPIKFEIWNNYEYNNLKNKIQQAPKNSVIIFTDFNKDKNKTVISKKMINQLLKKSPVPVFGRQEALLNNGLFGGMIVSGFHQGKTMGLLAEKILSGEKISSIPIIKKSPNQYMFDYNYMKKFSITEKDLPLNSIIINRPKSFYNFYSSNKEFVLGLFTIFLFVISIILIVSLLKIIKAKNEKESLIKKLKNKINQIKTLQGLLPICSNCKKIRDDQGYWKQIEEYITLNSDAQFSHSLCENCTEELYGDQEWYKKSKDKTDS